MKFRNYILQNFPFLEDDFDALTDYELFCKMIAYMKKALDEIKTYKDGFDKLEKELKDLENYVYNLDLQDEVNNKLDEMADSGELAGIISLFVSLMSLYVFDNVSDMLDGENLFDGARCQTLGFYAKGDNGGAFYVIRDKGVSETVDDIHTFELINDNTLVAEIVKFDYVNAKQLGAKDDIDNHDILDYAFTNYDHVTLDEIYPIESTILIEDKDGLIIDGNGGISIDQELQTNLFTINDSNNFLFKDITLTNGESHVGSDAPKFAYIMYGTNVSHFDFINIKMVDTYWRGIVLLTADNITFRDCLFKNGYYNMVTILTESHDILVDNCIFDTTTCSYINAYLFSTGADTYEVTTDYLCKNLTIKNSQFYNNPQWEAIDCHGGSNITIENNYIEDCKLGIMVGYDERPPVNNVYNENITIRNNKIVNKTLNNTRHGILVTGGDTIFGRNITIDNNYVENYSLVDTMYDIYIAYEKDYKITNNVVKKYKYGGIGIVATYNGIVENNILLENDENFAQTIGINFIAGNWLVYCRHNQLIGGKNPLYCGIRMGATRGITLLGDNLCLNTTNKYVSSSPNNTILGTVSNTNNRRFGCQGIHSVDNYDMIKSYCTDAVLRGNGETLSDISITSTSNTNELTINEDLNISYYLCIGEEIVLEGAGAGGTDLTTQIVDITSTTTFTIKDNIETSISNVNPKKTSSSWMNT